MAIGARQLDIEAVVDVAVRVFLERGYDGATMEQIAQAAGVRKASLYYHVSGKEELLERGVERALGAFRAMLNEPGANDTDPVPRLRYVLRRTCELVSGFVPEVALLIRARGNTATERKLMTERRRLNAFLAGLITDVHRKGDTQGRADSELVARLLLGMITSTVDWWREDGSSSGADLADAVEGLVFGGLL